MSTFTIKEGKAAIDEFPVAIDFSAWLAGETISTVVYSAIRTDTGADATATVLDLAKHTNTTTTAKPWIKGGTVGINYIVSIVMTSSAGAKKNRDAHLHCSLTSYSVQTA